MAAKRFMAVDRHYARLPGEPMTKRGGGAPKQHPHTPLWKERLTGLHHAFGRIVVMVLNLILVADHLAIELVDQFVDRRI